jgi:hypothetical protein
MISLGAIAIEPMLNGSRGWISKVPTGRIATQLILLARMTGSGSIGNSDCNYRLREVVPDEFPALDAPPHGIIWKVLIVKINHEVRVRTPVAYPRELPSEGRSLWLLGLQP